jgi:hypothetical protein
MAASFDPAKERWPPIYDAVELKATIAKVTAVPDVLFAEFYEQQIDQSEYSQGDIIYFDKEIPCIDENGEAVALEAETSFWMLLGNSCDLARDIKEVPWTLAIPIRNYPGIVTQEIINALKKYDYARGFYVPPWSEEHKNRLYLADFLRSVSLHRGALKQATVVARMKFCGWMLFHSCVVRFLARGDGRFD